MHESLQHFHPVIARWFTESIGEPTEIQSLSWPVIARSEHALITAPTGSGKTLTAFLWALNQLITGAWEPGRTRVLYISPLKALNNDIRRNLEQPLESLETAFRLQNVPFPRIRVMTRSGDTPAVDRARMKRRPPEILITTPESLNILLSSRGGQGILTGVKTVILDEIHAVISQRRGVYLITAVERLTRLSGEFQRIALSATVRPPKTVAACVGGFRRSDPSPGYEPRPVTIISSSIPRQYEISVRYPPSVRDRSATESLWTPLADDFRRLLHENRSTLFFTNSRKLCEKITTRINRNESYPLAYAHHGSLSREIRGEVERRLKAGDLKAIVATNSLELGIDIGALDAVVLVQSPKSVSAAIQRVGRAGHQVGAICRGIIYPTHPVDFIAAAVLAKGIPEQAIEAVTPMESPLDVLAQLIISMTAVETRDIDDLFADIRMAWPYRDLSRDSFDLVLNMLAGKYADTRIQALKPRVSIDRLDNTVRAHKGAIHALYTSGGVIPDRGYFRLRHAGSNALIGELDEEFVWEAAVGQTFILGTQKWKIEKITHNDVMVTSGLPDVQATPFWKAEAMNRDFHMSVLMGDFLEEAEERVNKPGFEAYLQDSCSMDPDAAKELADVLNLQREHTGGQLPHRHHILVENIASGPGSAPGTQMVLHTFWGGRVNRPFAMALSAAWEKRFGDRLEIFAADDCIGIQLPRDDVSPDEIFTLVTPESVLELLRSRLENSGFFGARFRECAGRALLVTRRKFNQRQPLWMTRLKTKRLYDAVSGFPDFPIILEAWRTCLHDEFDLDSLKLMLSEIQCRKIVWSEAHTATASPFARSVAWRQINQYMYEGDELPGGRSSSLSVNLMDEFLSGSGVLPALPMDIIRRFEDKRQRLYPGYAPGSPEDLLDWVKERLFIPDFQWEGLGLAVERDSDLPMAELSAIVAGKLARVTLPETGITGVCALENLPEVIEGISHGLAAPECMDLAGRPIDPASVRTMRVMADDSESEDPVRDFLVQWLLFYGPVSAEIVQKQLGISVSVAEGVLREMTEESQVVRGLLIEGSDTVVFCDRDNYETLLRMRRSEATMLVTPRKIEDLGPFLASWQGLADAAKDRDGLGACLEQLFYYSAEAAVWETEIFPARIKPYDPAWLDSLMADGNMIWFGAGKGRVTFGLPHELDLLSRSDKENPLEDTSADLIPDAHGKYDFHGLMHRTGLPATELSEKLWNAVWRGDISNDTFTALRKGIETGFRVPDAAGTGDKRLRPGRRGGRTAFSRWKGSIPAAGNWYHLPEMGSDEEEDLILEAERMRDRVRVLLDRYGILFREFLRREQPGFQWKDLFRSLRLMELAGEVISGCFFEGLSGPQFMSHRGFRWFQRKIPKLEIYWVNAVDPASVCGMGVDALKSMMPRRHTGTHVVYRGVDIVIISLRNGGELTIRVPETDPDLPEMLGFMRHLLERSFKPLKRISIKTINGTPAVSGPYLDIFRMFFDLTMDAKQVVLYRRF